MLRLTTLLGLCLTTSLLGCSSISNLMSSNKKAQNSTASTPSGSSIGSSELTSSNKLNNPAKLHLAYAAWSEQSGELAAARESYQKVLQKNPKDVDAMLGLARIDRAIGHVDEADEMLNKTLKKHPKDPRVFVAMGQAHASKQEWDQAIESMQTACKLAPYETIYTYHLALVEAGAGDIPHAMDHFKRSVGEAEAHFNVGFILKEQGRTSEAETHLIEAIRMKPDLKQAQAALASLRSGGKEDDIMPASYNKNPRRR